MLERQSRSSCPLSSRIVHLVINMISPLFRLIRLTSPSRNQLRAFSKGTKNSPSLVIFDKDGTLICFHTMWTPWVTGMAHGLEIGTGLGNRGLGMDVFRLLGVCSETKQIGPGLVAEATMPEIKGRLTQLLAIYGFLPDSSKEIVDAVWNDNEKLLHAESVAIKPIIDNMPMLFQTLRAHNFKIAICTADNRKSTERTLKYLKLMDLVNAIVCGDDRDSRPKPNPYNAFKICRQLEVPSWRAYMVGDTLADLCMGKEAGFAASIGVLSGIGTKDYLAPFADYIIHNVGEVLSVLVGDETVIAPTCNGTTLSANTNGKHYGKPSIHGNNFGYDAGFMDYSHSMKELLRS